MSEPSKVRQAIGPVLSDDPESGTGTLPSLSVAPELLELHEKWGRRSTAVLRTSAARQPQAHISLESVALPLSISSGLLYGV